ncbi:hypothetical protein [Rurimicrobium arvi]|uniref:hypothetical protein n=1 Tax=Rurimicrobium arvi TaxID=2049916 RepID=UPI0031D0FDCC
MGPELKNGIIVLISILAGIGLFLYCLMLIDASNGSASKKESTIEINFKLNTDN